MSGNYPNFRLRTDCANLALSFCAVRFLRNGRCTRAVGGEQSETPDRVVEHTADDVAAAVDQITEDPGYREYETVWQGISLTIRHNPCWLGRCAGLRTHHIELSAAERVGLPVTSTGYRSHFLHGEEPFTEFGGDVVAYVQAWLDHEAERPEWKRHVEASRQLSLF